MLRIFLAAITCLLLSLIPCSCINITDNTLNILYGVIGVMFSVGMSLVVSFKVSNVKNPIYKTSLRESMHDVRNSFLCIFSSCTFSFVVYSLLDEKSQKNVWIENESITLISSWALSILIYFVYSIIALINNYVELQKLYEGLEDKMQKEERNE